ncbi:hypothetical protein Tco_1531877 [Tanacetum coccineum]
MEIDLRPLRGQVTGGYLSTGVGVTNDCRLDTPDACQDMVDHIVPLGSKIARRDQRIQVREEEIKKLGQEIQSFRAVESEGHSLQNQTKNLKTLLEAEVDIKKVAEAKNAELAKELDSLRVQFSDLQVSNNQLAKQVLNLQAQVTSEEKIKAAFEEFKKYEDDKVEQRCAEMDALLDKLRLAKGLSEGLKYGIEHGKAGRDLADIEAYDSEANSKLVKALKDLKDLKYLMVDQLERLKDAPMELIMASLHLEKEMLLEDAIAANISQAEKKKKCRVVCRTHGIGSIHYARSDGIPVSAPTVVPHGLAILLADAATQTEATDKEEKPHPRLQRSISLPPINNL